MELNTFPTNIHGKTNRISLVLIYAVLEWTLIFFLLLNSLFSYFIFKFARYFGLKPPCLLCSRVDHIFEPHNSQLSYRNLICEQHSVELSKSGYCFSHRKLVESQDMCVDCSSSHTDLSSSVDKLMCSCCGVAIRSRNLPTHFVIEPSVGVLGDTQKGNLVSKDGYVGDFDLDGSSRDFQMDFGSDLKREKGSSDEGFLLGNAVLEAGRERLLREFKSNATILSAYENEIILPQHLEFYIDNDDYGLIPVELLNLDQGKGSQVWRETDDELVFEPNMELPAALVDGEQNLNSCCLDTMQLDEPISEDYANKPAQGNMKMEDDVVRLDETKIENLPTIQEEFKEEVVSTLKSHEAKIEGLLIEEEIKEVDSDVEVDGIKVEKFPTMQGQAEETKGEIYLEAAGAQEHCVLLTKSDDHVTELREVNELNVKIPSKDFIVVCHKKSNEVSIENDKVYLAEPSTTGVICDVSTSSSGLLEHGHHGSKKMDTEEKGKNYKQNELNELEEDRIPDTPTSIDSFQILHRQLLLLGRSKTVIEESLDASVVNDLEHGDGEVTFEELKSELRAERKAFRALYEELEEERSAAAVATSQTMAMINRLQEEKAAIEMEALQYQRMMEEQAEYDQEALQLMNEILVKREREKEELQMELEVCMKKLMEFEERERINQGKDGTSSVSCRNEETGGLNIVLNNDSKENGHHAVLNLKDSLSCFEEERISILEQLKVLEENLCALAVEEEQQIRNLNPFEQFYQENVEELSKSFKFNSITDGSLNTNGERHQEKTTNGSKPNQFLHQLNAAALVSDNESLDEVEGRLDPFLLDELPLTHLESEKRRFTIEEEVERLYERLQALEEDKEFIKHCFESLRKGDRGIDLLQEILQHLRDLKSAEFRARNVDGVC